MESNQRSAMSVCSTAGCVLQGFRVPSSAPLESGLPVFDHCESWRDTVLHSTAFNRAARTV